MQLSFGRYIEAREFAGALRKLHIFPRGYVDKRFLERLEEARLVVPRIRLCFPDSVARRLWIDNHSAHWEPTRVLKLEIEEDGPRWDAAIALCDALDRWRNPTIFGFTSHPFDNPEDRFAQFIEDPSTVPFRSGEDRRVDVSNNVEKELFDDTHCEAFYATWQLLLAAEISEDGFHFRLNVADQELVRSAWESVHNGRIPSANCMFNTNVHCVRPFYETQKHLDAVLWFAEETNRILQDITKEHVGRYRLSGGERASYIGKRQETAEASGIRYSTNIDDLIALCGFLSEQWSTWHDNGRPFIAGAYKEFLGRVVLMTRLLGNLPFTDIRDRVGRRGGRFKPVLDEIWPDWVETEKRRVRRTLKALINKGGVNLLEEDVSGFVDFVEQQHLEAFFWLLKSFEQHAFKGGGAFIEGMKSDLQGLAISVEHIVRALAGESLRYKVGQLYDVLKKLWANSPVADILKQDDISSLARQPRPAEEWPILKTKINVLRDGGEASIIAADLVMAHRIRGSVHYVLPETDIFELQALFVTLMRAAVLTFKEVHLTSSQTRS